MAQNILVCAHKDVGFYFLFSTPHWQECRCDGNATAATLGHEMETASLRGKRYKAERVRVHDTIKPSSNPGLLSFRLISERKRNYLLVWETFVI